MDGGGLRARVQNQDGMSEVDLVSLCTTGCEKLSTLEIFPFQHFNINDPLPGVAAGDYNPIIRQVGGNLEETR